MADSNQPPAASQQAAERGSSLSDGFWLVLTGNITAGIVAAIWFRAVNRDPNVAMKHASRGSIAEITIIVIVLAATNLAMVDRYSEGIATLFGAVAGYVLGRGVRSSSRNREIQSTERNQN